jgi:His/Glu/Gln/Arg/opine family amino acid ABC transporter permease subunit
MEWIPRYGPRLAYGALVTLQLAVLSMALALPLGLLLAVGRMSKSRLANRFVAIYVEIWRGVPLIVQLLIIYFTLPQIGISIPAFGAAVLGLALNLAAYLSEVFRAAIQSVDPGQYEAGEAIGMSHVQVYTRIVLPQAFLVALPTIGGYFISLIKDCALVSFISVNELLRTGTMIIAETFQSMRVYLVLGVMYFTMSFVAARIVRLLEVKLMPRYMRPNAAARPVIVDSR